MTTGPLKKVPSKKVRSGDKVVVTAGNSRGKIGKVVRVVGDKIVVEGVNLRKKHMRATRTAKGGIIEMEMPIHVSNVRVCVEGDRPVKLHVKENSEGQRELYYKDGSNEVVYRTLGHK